VLTSQSIDPNQDGNRKPMVLLRPFIAAWQWLVPPTQAHRDRQSTTARWVAIGSLITGCLTVIIAGFFYAKPIQDKFQDWQAEKLYEEAKVLANDGQLPSAFARLQQAVKIAPENINAIRMNAEFLTLARRPEALHFLDQLERHGATKDSDKQMRVRALLNLQRPKEASQLLEQILSNQVPSDVLMKLAEDVWGKSQKDDMLVKALKNYAEKHPDDRMHSLRLARIQIKSTSSSEVADGMRLIWKVAEGKDELSLQALELMDSFENLPPDEANRLIQLLRAHPKGNGWHIVAALRRQLRQEPLRKNALIEEAITMARGRKREDLVPLVRWLVEPPQNEALKVLALVSEAEAKSYQPLLQNYLNALTVLGRYSDLERLVDDPKVNSILSQSTHTFYRAHLAYVLNKSAEETRAALIQAKNAADIEHQSDLLQRIATYAEERGHSDIAEEAYRAVALNPKTERIGFQGLIRTTEINGNTEGLIAAAGEAVRRWPDDGNYLEHFLYVNLLAGRELELALTQVEKLLDLQPKDSERRLLVGLAYWRLGDTASAVKYIADMDLIHLTAGQKAVLAAIARDCDVTNAKEAAWSALQEIDPKAKMLPEERACYAKAGR
jgi:tetratricopeptide (TPR) repeat protein